MKNSGFLRKLHKTKLDERINEYYSVVGNISEQENSLNNTIENLQIYTYNDNILQQIFRIEKVLDKEAYFSKHKREIKELLHHPSLTGATKPLWTSSP